MNYFQLDPGRKKDSPTVYGKHLNLSPKKIHPLFRRRIGTKIDMNGPSVRLKIPKPE
jgi:hypothetical protein